MWKLCCDCGFEIDPSVYSADDVGNYGCPVCGSFDLDDEVEEKETDK